MSDASKHEHSDAPPHVAVIVLGIAGVVALLAAAILLWARDGAAVFFDMVVAGVISCF